MLLQLYETAVSMTKNSTYSLLPEGPFETSLMIKVCAVRKWKFPSRQNTSIAHAKFTFLFTIRGSMFSLNPRQKYVL